MTDTLFIQQLAVKTTIGVYDWEKKIKQTLVFDIEMNCDISVAAHSDQINDTVDYAIVAQAITAHVSGHQFELIETVAEQVAAIILNDFAVSRVMIKLQKPGAVENAQSVGVRIVRQKSEPNP